MVRLIDKRIRKRNAVLLGGLLHVAREEMGLTQTDLAQRLGKEQPFVSQYESGQCFLDLTQFILICHELCVDPPEMLKELEKRGVGFEKEQSAKGTKAKSRSRNGGAAGKSAGTR